jgi:hypothetical protein
MKISVCEKLGTIDFFFRLRLQSPMRADACSLRETVAIEGQGKRRRERKRDKAESKKRGGEELRNDPKAAKILDGQVNIFEARRDDLASQSAILRQRVAQYEEEIVGIKGQIVPENRQTHGVRLPPGAPIAQSRPGVPRELSGGSPGIGAAI